MQITWGQNHNTKTYNFVVYVCGYPYDSLSMDFDDLEQFKLN